MITLSVNGKPRDLNIPDDLLMAAVRAALATATTGSNDIDADALADVDPNSPREIAFDQGDRLIERTWT
ncbi:MAG TPA: hypothetical protein VKG21_00855 [Casimicrobiaceae bacterium]|nr:hypothetical protein [Casimicrobiaceae bacterium]